MNVTILGNEYPLEYTVEAQSKIAERFGAIENIENIFDTGVAKVTENIVFMLSAMMEAAENRERVLCSIMCKEYTGRKALTEQELKSVIRMQDFKYLQSAVMATLTEGSKASVETEEEKKEEAMQ